MKLRNIKKEINRHIGEKLYMLSTKYDVINNYSVEEKHKFYNMFKELKEMGFLMYLSDARLLHEIFTSSLSVPGCIAECGVYKGGSAKIICELKGDRHLYLFDTFDGLPKPSEWDSKGFKEGKYKSNFIQVRNLLEGYENVYMYQGFFKDTLHIVEFEKFSFVNIDADLYQSIKDSLEFFYPRMSKGGFMLSHDYHLDGGKKAINEFFKDKPETPINLGIQCLIIKT